MAQKARTTTCVNPRSRGSIRAVTSCATAPRPKAKAMAENERRARLTPRLRQDRRSRPCISPSTCTPSTSKEKDQPGRSPALPTRRSDTPHRACLTLDGAFRHDLLLPQICAFRAVDIEVDHGAKIRSRVSSALSNHKDCKGPASIGRSVRHIAWPQRRAVNVATPKCRLCRKKLLRILHMPPDQFFLQHTRRNHIL